MTGTVMTTLALAIWLALAGALIGGACYVLAILRDEYRRRKNNRRFL